MAGAGGDDVEDFGGACGTDAEVGLLCDHLGQRLGDSGPLLWQLFLDSWKIKRTYRGKADGHNRKHKMKEEALVIKKRPFALGRIPSTGLAGPKAEP